MGRSERPLSRHGRTHRFAVDGNETRGWARRKGEVERDGRRCPPERGGPGRARRAEARAQRSSRSGDRLPFREIPVVHDIQGTEDPVHVPRPGNVLRVRSH